MVCPACPQWVVHCKHIQRAWTLNNAKNLIDWEREKVRCFEEQEIENWSWIRKKDIWSWAGKGKIWSWIRRKKLLWTPSKSRGPTNRAWRCRIWSWEPIKIFQRNSSLYSNGTHTILHIWTFLHLIVLILKNRDGYYWTTDSESTR